MDEIQLAEVVFRVLRDRRQNCADFMLNGNVKSMEHYRELMGNLECLNHVEQELKSLLDQQELMDD